MTIHTASIKTLSQFCLSLLLLSTAPLLAAETVTTGKLERIPIADVHLHYNPSHTEITNTDEALQQLYDNNVQFAVISSKPPSMALELVEAAGGWIIPFYMPYLEPDRKRDWYFDDRVLPAAREALASGVYRGLGEMHLIVGFAPSTLSKMGRGLCQSLRMRYACARRLLLRSGRPESRMRRRWH